MKPIQCNLAAAIICWAALAVAPRASAQTPPGLNLQLYAGLSITGAVGTVYSVEYVTDLAANELLALSGVPATARQPVSVGRQVRAGDGPAVLPGGGVCRAHEPGVHPAGHLQDGQPDERSGPGARPSNREGPQTAVTISKGFWMGKYLVTQGEYLAVMGSNPSSASDG